MVQKALGQPVAQQGVGGEDQVTVGMMGPEVLQVIWMST